jgi:hypothetical protein
LHLSEGGPQVHQPLNSHVVLMMFYPYFGKAQDRFELEPRIRKIPDTDT